MSVGSQRGRLAWCALLKQKKTARAQFPEIVARARALCSKMLFELASISDYPKNNLDLTLPGRRPSEFVINDNCVVNCLIDNG